MELSQNTPEAIFVPSSQLRTLQVHLEHYFTGKDLMDDEKQGDVLLLFAGAVSSGQEDHSLTKFSSLYQNGQGHKLENTGGTTNKKLALNSIGVGVKVNPPLVYHNQICRHHPSDSSATKLPSNARGLP
ncbi:unnamed protein product [Lactuca saligna]|uniref:Uncharacterized protein n=1 Tax=Lactuca saligna TaxID=75948 RepID=A0AA35Y8I2_LACSI|nr:unnamed protein product [Lactuca saligna]